jgi:Uma2 family endonuclease
MSLPIKNIFLPHYTYEDYKLWEGRWELINGIPFSMAPSPSWKHQDINVNIISQLKSKLANCNSKCIAIMSTDWIVEDDTVLAPDVSVTCEPIDGKFLTKTPELIFEILSPSTVLKDKNTKFQLYEIKKVLYYVIVDPKTKSFEIFYLVNDEYQKINLTENLFDFKLKSCNIPFDFSNIWAD